MSDFGVPFDAVEFRQKEQIALARKEGYEAGRASALQERKELRDQFAMAALTVVAARPSSHGGVPLLMVKAAYEIADAMLEARNEP